MSFEVKSFYSNKTILITGCTGYLAKIILEKIIRSCSDFKKIYVLMRSKQGISIQERLQNEVLSSHMFTLLYEKRPELEAVVKTRLIAVQGDLSLAGLGIDPIVRKEIINDLDIIINSAASINFREHLLDALKTNYYGAVRILELAHECKHLQVLSHISTAFVGSNYPNMTRLNEKIQDDLCKDDWEVQVANLNKMGREEVKQNEEALIYGYHNTYTYTKNLAERHYERYRGNIPIVINRPSGIIHCTAEPVPGWIDTVSAVGVAAFPLGMGFARSIFVPDGIIDFIPGDYVSNAVLATTAYIATLPVKEAFKIFHNSSGTANPFYVLKFWVYAVEYLKYNPFEKQIRQPRWYPIAKESNYNTLVYLQDDLPAKLTEFVAKLPIIGSKSTLEAVKKFQKMRTVIEDLNEDVNYFKHHYWFYDCTELLKIIPMISPKDIADFEFDPRKVNFPKEGARMLYGIQRYYLDQDVPLCDSGLRGILQQNHFDWGHDLRFGLKVNQIVKQKDLKALHNEILSPVKFQQFLSLAYGQNRNKDKKLIGGLLPPVSPGTIIQLNKQDALTQLQQLDTTVNKKAWPPLLIYMNKTFRNALEGIYINDPGLDNVKELLAKGEKVVLIPIYKSFLDLSLLLYALYVNDIDFPFSFGNFDDVPTAALIDKLLANSGYISAKRSRQQSLQQSYIHQAVLREVINKHPLCILFQNDIRLRTGKMTQPIQADLGILWLMQTYLTSLQKEGKTVHLIPVAINYERVFEVRNLATEMVSGKVPRLGLFALLKMLGSEKEGKLGRVFINFGKQLNLQDYLKNINMPVITYENIDEASLRLSEKLYKEQQHQYSANLSWIVATLLLQESGKRVQMRNLLANCIAVHRYLKARRVPSVMTIDPTLFSITKVVKKLGFKIQKLAIQPKGRNNEMEVILDPKDDQKNLLGLSYYSNALMQSQVIDCCIGYTLDKHITNKKSISVDDLLERVTFMEQLFRFEFIDKLKLRPITESLNSRLTQLSQLREIVITDGVISKTAKVQPFSFVNFFNKMGQHLMDTYLVVLMAIMEICNGGLEVLEENLVDELHKMLITMTNQGLVLNLQSCLKETIMTALSRYYKMGLVDQKTFQAQNGARTTYYSSMLANKTKLQETINTLLEFKCLQSDEFQIWGERISEAVENSLVMYMTMAAKL